MPRRQQRVRLPGLPPPKRTDDRRTIHRTRHRLPHPPIPQHRVRHVEVRIDHHRARPTLRPQVPLVPKRMHHIKRDHIALRIRRPLLQLQRRRNRIRNHRKPYPLHPPRPHRQSRQPKPLPTRRRPLPKLRRPPSTRPQSQNVVVLTQRLVILSGAQRSRRTRVCTRRPHRSPHPSPIRPIVPVPLQHHLLILHRAHKPKRPRPHRPQPRSSPGPPRHHPEQPIAHVEQQSRIRPLQPHHHRQPVPRLHARHRSKRPTLRRHQPPGTHVDHRPNRPRHILRLERPPIMKPHPIAQMKSPTSKHPAAPTRSPATAAVQSAHPSAPAHQRSAHPPAPTAHPSPPEDPGCSDSTRSPSPPCESSTRPLQPDKQRNQQPHRQPRLAPVPQRSER